MKKAVVLGMILLALSTLAYADANSAVNFGFGRTTFTLAQGSSVSGSDIEQGWENPPGFPVQPRANMALSYSGDHMAYHLQAYLDGTALSWPGFYGTLKLMPDMFSVMIGRFDDDGWDNFRKTSSHPLKDTNNGRPGVGNVGRFGGWGVIAEVSPKDSGFDAAVMYRTADPTGTGAFYGLSGTASNTNIAASYIVPNTVKITAGSIAQTLYVADRNIFGRVELLMVPNLTLWADVAYDGFDVKPTSVSNINAMVNAAYDMKPLTIVVAAKYGSNDIVGTKVGTWAVYPEVYYNAGMLTVGLYGNASGSDIANSGIVYQVEPYVLLNDFNTRISFLYTGTTAAAPLNISTWQIPVVINWGF